MSEKNQEQPEKENIFSLLEKVFHEPNRLSLMSALAGTDSGLTFNQLKEECQLTDGNLSRHVKTLEDAGMVTIKKEFVGVKPQTTVTLSDKGRDSFIQYLGVLEEALQKAAKAVDPKRKRSGIIEKLFGARGAKI
ncbi:MAG: transcriptional regulator [Verrucomicrobiota bacterium]|nr:transcriptional regulator [Verrucomicrobiota bacterium]